MLQFMADAINVVDICLIGVVLYVTCVTRTMVKGTRGRYIAKTMLIAAIVAAMLGSFARCLVVMLVNTHSPSYVVGSVIGEAIVVAICGTYLHAVLRDGGDDWFNDQWNKIKDWSTRLGSVTRNKLAPITITQ